MTLSLIIFICVFVILLVIAGVRFVELKKGRYFIKEKFRFGVDEKIKQISLAVFKNAVKIKKLIYREIAQMPGKIVKISHIIWSKIKHKVDKFYERMHR